MSDFSGANGYSLDYRVIFIAACSSFITLLLFSVLDRYPWLQIQFHKSNTDSDVQSATANVYNPPKIDRPLSASTQSLFDNMDNMISKDFYNYHSDDGDSAYFESDEYLHLIPLNDPQWIKRKLTLLIKGRYSESLHQRMLDHFDPKAFEPPTNPFLKEITTAMRRFNEWRRWPVQTRDHSGWKYRATKKDMKVWTHALPNSQLEIVKCEKIIALPLVALVGVLFTPKHVYRMDPVLKNMEFFHGATGGSISSALVHLFVKCPFPLTDRDFANVAMLYFFKDGSCLMGSTKCSDDSLFKENTDHVRATITLMMYHIRPNYDGNINLTKITLYSHVLLNGSIPQWMLNFAYMEIADTLLKMEKYVKKNMHILHKRGELWLPPNPFLKMMGL